MENWKIEKDLCRCCHSEGSFRPLTEMCAIGGEEGYYIDMLRLTLHITLKPVEGPLHPNTYTICDDCIMRVKDATAFKQQVRLCEERFQDMYSRGIIKLEGEQPAIKVEPDIDDQKMDSEAVPDVNASEPHRPWRTDGDDLPDDDDVDDTFEPAVKVDIEVCKVEPDPIDTKRRSARTKKPVVKQDKKEKPKRQPKKPKVQAETSTEGENAAKKDALESALANFVVHAQGGGKVYTCQECGLNLESVSLIQQHIKTDHLTPAKSDFECYVCQQTFKSLGPRNRHLFKNHGLKEVKIEGGYDVLPAQKYTCAECKTEFADKRALCKHIRLYHRIRKCPDCPVELVKKELARHRSDVHGMSMPTCGICGYKALKPSTIIKHQSVHQKTCETCKKDFPSKKSLVTHKIRYHKTYKCQDCPIELPRDDLARHRAESHRATPPQCGICGYKHIYESMVVRHQRRVHLQEKNVSCTICDAKFYCPATLSKHMVKHNPVKKFECSFCQKKFPRKSTLREHVKIHTGDKQKVCKICDQRFVQKASLNYHMAKYHPEACATKLGHLKKYFTERQDDGNQLFTCNLCDVEKPRKNLMYTHIRLAHLNECKYKCNVCEIAFKRNDQKNRHLAKCHGIEEVKINGKLTVRPAQKVTCDECKKDFLGKVFLVRHQLIHRKFKCPDCPVLLLERPLFRHRVQVHGANVPTCGVCGFTHTSQDGIVKHQRKVHLKEKNISCPHCEDMFFDLILLKKHLVKHNPVKIFECRICKKRFPRVNALNQHVKIHTGDKRKVCNLCGQRFVQKASLNYHMTKHHPEAC